MPSRWMLMYRCSRCSKTEESVQRLHLSCGCGGYFELVGSYLLQALKWQARAGE